MKRLIGAFLIVLVLGTGVQAGINPFYSPLDKLEKLDSQAAKEKEESARSVKEGSSRVFSLEIVGVIKVGRLYLLEARNNGEIKFYKRGDRVNGWTLKEISFDRVVFSNGKEKQVIPID